ncbi:MAG: PBSX family phage terminase large subunit, partial [Oscillospiraceae bacterium]
MIYQNDKILRITDLISKNFYEMHKSILQNKFTHYWIKGGRGSTKSSFVSLEIILGMIKNKDTNAIVFRKVGANLKESVFEQMKWAIYVLGLDDMWEQRTNPLTLIYKQTGQKIFFKGTDNPQKIKSTKVKNGYIRYIWYEETDEFAGLDEIRSINQSLMRGGDIFNVFYTFNPPKNASNWCNLAVADNREDTVVFHTNYLDVNKNWLSKAFIYEAEILKNKNYISYCHEYLGQCVGYDQQVFRNLTFRKIEEQEIFNCFSILRGVDWGYAADPFVYIVLAYDNKKKVCYIFHEFYKVGAKFKEIVEKIKEENIKNQTVIADSAEPRSND